MSQNSTTKHVWYKHKSKKRKELIYYYNPDTKESVWEKPENAEIIDKTEEPVSTQPEIASSSTTTSNITTSAREDESFDYDFSDEDAYIHKFSRSFETSTTNMGGSGNLIVRKPIDPELKQIDIERITTTGSTTNRLLPISFTRNNERYSFPPPSWKSNVMSINLPKAKWSRNNRYEESEPQVISTTSPVKGSRAIDSFEQHLEKKLKRSTSTPGFSGSAAKMARTDTKIVRFDDRKTLNINYKTPIQDRYNKNVQELLRKQKEKEQQTKCLVNNGVEAPVLRDRLIDILGEQKEREAKCTTPCTKSIERGSGHDRQNGAEKRVNSKSPATNEEECFQGFRSEKKVSPFGDSSLEHSWKFKRENFTYSDSNMRKFNYVNENDKQYSSSGDSSSERSWRFRRESPTTTHSSVRTPSFVNVNDKEFRNPGEEFNRTRTDINVQQGTQPPRRTNFFRRDKVEEREANCTIPCTKSIERVSGLESSGDSSSERSWRFRRENLTATHSSVRTPNFVNKNDKEYRNPGEGFSRTRASINIQQGTQSPIRNKLFEGEKHEGVNPSVSFMCSPTNRKRKFFLEKDEQLKIPKLVNKETSVIPSSGFNCPLMKEGFDLRSKLQSNNKGKDSTLSLVDDNAHSVSEMEWEDVEASHLNDWPKRNENCSDKTPASEVTGKKYPDYSTIYLVCDTCSLFSDPTLVEKLMVSGNLLGLSVKIIIPLAVIDELDHKKSQADIGHKARQAIRLIYANKDSNLTIQDGISSKVPEGILDIINNDDSILNCCLQQQKICKEGELVILMTEDINLNNKASSFKVMAHSWDSLRKWIRGYREERRLILQSRIDKTSFYTKSSSHMLLSTSGVERMELENSAVSECNSSVFENSHESKSFLNKTSISSEVTEADLQAKKNISIGHFYVSSLIDEFQSYLHNVLNQALDNHYGDLKSHSNRILPSWVLMDYIREVTQRWSIVKEGLCTPNQVQNIFRSIIALVKKHYQGMEEFSESEVDDIYSLCKDLAKYLNDKYFVLTEPFLIRLSELYEEWRTKNNSSADDVNQGILDDDVVIHPAYDSAQNIYNFLKTEYDNFRTGVKTDGDESITLRDILTKVSDLLYIFKWVFRTRPERLTTSDKSVIQLHKMLSSFPTGEDNKSPIQFDLSCENVISLFLEHRDNVQNFMSDLYELEKNIQEIISEQEDDF